MTLNDLLTQLETLKGEHGGDIAVVVSDAHIPAASAAHSTTSVVIPGAPAPADGVIVIGLTPSRRM